VRGTVLRDVNVSKNYIVSTANNSANRIGSAANVSKNYIVTTDNNSRIGSAANVSKNNIVSTSNNASTQISKTSNDIIGKLTRTWKNIFG
jgi:Mg2+ and Co2+ transporter CorA